MPVRTRKPEDDKPLFKAVNEQRLVGTVGGAQDGTAEAAQEEPRGAATEQAPPQAEGSPRAEKGPVSRVLDKAQENNWVYDSVANRARESGLAAKADELLSRLTGR